MRTLVYTSHQHSVNIHLIHDDCPSLWAEARVSAVLVFSQGLHSPSRRLRGSSNALWFKSMPLRLWGPGHQKGLWCLALSFASTLVGIGDFWASVPRPTIPQRTFIRGGQSLRVKLLCHRENTAQVRDPCFWWQACPNVLRYLAKTAPNPIPCHPVGLVLQLVLFWLPVRVGASRPIGEALAELCGLGPGATAWVPMTLLKDYFLQPGRMTYNGLFWHPGPRGARAASPVQPYPHFVCSPLAPGFPGKWLPFAW